MGYYINQLESCFVIKKDKQAAALAAIKALATQTELMGGGSSTGEKWFAWVKTEEFLKAETLAKALLAWRWKVSVDPETENINHIAFQGEKLGDDEILFSAIAPYVEPGSYINIQGEITDFWQWAFDGETLRNRIGGIVYED